MRFTKGPAFAIFWLVLTLLVAGVSSFQPLARFASQSSIVSSARRATMSPTEVDDPYTYLEEVESEESLDFAKKANDNCLAALGDPTTSETYRRVLAVLESDDRIPYAGKMGYNMEGEEIVYNFWKDSKNPKGLWRTCTMESYKSDKPVWRTVLDLDKLAEKDATS